MHFVLHRVRSHELIRAADEYRLAQRVMKAGSAPRTMPPPAQSPTPRHLPARLRG